MIGWVVAGVVICGIAFLVRARFVPGMGVGVPSPDKTFSAKIMTKKARPGPIAQTTYEVSVAKELRTSGTSFLEFRLFERTVTESEALHDLRNRKTGDIIKWDADSSSVTITITREPIVVDVKKLASVPETQKRMEEVLREAEKRTE